MSIPVSRDLDLIQGATYRHVVSVGKTPWLYVPITAISKSAPARITAPSHDLPDAWPVAIVDVVGMRQINATSIPPSDEEFFRATVIDADTLDLNEVSSARFSAYVSGGYVMAMTPINLTGATADLVIRNRVGGTELIRLDENDGLVIDTAAHTVEIVISDTLTIGVQWKTGVYDLEITLANGDVLKPLIGAVRISWNEITS